jgi:hypothetical protein
MFGKLRRDRVDRADLEHPSMLPSPPFGDHVRWNRDASARQTTRSQEGKRASLTPLEGHEHARIEGHPACRALTVLEIGH